VRAGDVQLGAAVVGSLTAESQWLLRGNHLHTTAYTSLHWNLEGETKRLVLTSEVFKMAETGGGERGNQRTMEETTFS
jgi:hypothetical protein